MVRKTPDRSSLPVLCRIEAYLKLPSETLTSVWTSGRVAKGKVAKRYFPGDYQDADSDRTRAEIAKFLPDDFTGRSEAHQQSAMTEAVAQFEKKRSDGRKWASIRSAGYALPCEYWPAQLKEQWRKVVDFKVNGAAIENYKGDEIRAERSWRESTAKIHEQRLALFFGFIANHSSDHLKISIERLDLTLLLSREMIEAYFKFKQDRAKEYGNTPRITQTDLDLVTFAAAMLSPHDGFLRMQWKYLGAIGKLSNQIRFANRGADKPWTSVASYDEANAFAEDSLQALKSYERSFRGRDKFNHEHGDRLKDFLGLPKPLSAAYEGLQRHDDDILKSDPSKSSYHRGFRMSVLLHIALQCGFRVGTFVKLTYREDQTGNLRRDGDGWVVAVEPEILKNGNASTNFHGGKGFTRKLSDINGCFAMLEEYITVSRPALLDGSASDKLLINTSKKPDYKPVILDALVRMKTSRLFGEGAGDHRIGSVEKFPLHGFRDILATSVLKQTRDYQSAADAIGDSVEITKKHYSRWQLAERLEDMSSVLEQAAKN